MIKLSETYTVKPGDTLYGISNQYGVSVTELAELNNIKGDNLKIGEVLKIPSNTGSNPNNMFMYTVKSGDTLYKIAIKYNTTVDAIKNLNYLKNDNLTVGTVLRIPETYTKEEDLVLPNYINYTVEKGDSLYSIAKKYNISVDTIIKDNSLSSNNLTIGQNLKIRIPSSSNIEIEECIGPDYTPPSDDIPYITYTVKKGDSLYSIANKYNTSVSAITSLNNLPNNNLTIGQQLKIPNNSNTESKTYIVQKGDSLYSVAKKFNTTVDNIKRKNNLTSNTLQIGQKLNI